MGFYFPKLITEKWAIDKTRCWPQEEDKQVLGWKYRFKLYLSENLYAYDIA